VLSDSYLTASAPQSSLGAVVQTSIRVYAKEARQEPTTAPDTVGVENVVRTRLREVESAIVLPGAVERPNKPSSTKAGQPKELPEERTQKWVTGQLSSLAALLPPNHELQGRVQRLLKDFRPVREELLAARDSNFLEGFAVGTRYEGKLYNAGRYGLIIVAIEAGGKEVWAELYDPQNPDAGRTFAGAVVDDQITGRKALVLAALAPTPGGFGDTVQTITARADEATNGPLKLKWRLSKQRFDKGGD
jgi:hypothetical protein